MGEEERVGMDARARLWMGIVATLVIGTVAAGCGDMRRARMAHLARRDLMGMSRGTLLQCAGMPVKQERVGEREYLTYVSDLTLAPKSCVGTFVLRYDVLERIEYSAPSGRLPEEWKQCAVLVENCIPKEEG